MRVARFTQKWLWYCNRVEMYARNFGVACIVGIGGRSKPKWESDAAPKWIWKAWAL